MPKRPATALFRILRDRFARDIAAGLWKPGQAIASERSLAQRHGVAVNTVRKAVDLLIAEGLIERVAPVGTFVKRPSFETATIRDVRCHGSAADHRTPGSRILNRSLLIAPKNVSTALQLVTRAEVIRLLRMRFEGDTPVSVEEIWLHAQRFRGILAVPDVHPPLMYPYYEAVFGQVVAKVEEVVEIGVASRPDVEALGVDPGSPMVIVSRLAFGYDGRPLEWRQVRTSATDFHYKIEVR